MKIINTQRIEKLVETIAEISNDVEIHTICREILYEIDISKNNERKKWSDGFMQIKHEKQSFDFIDGTDF